MNREELLARLRALPWDSQDYWLITGGAMVLYGLRERGWELPLDALTVNDCADAVANALKAKG